MKKATPLPFFYWVAAIQLSNLKESAIFHWEKENNLNDKQNKIKENILLARVIKKKDKEAFDQLYSRYYPYVKSIISSYIKPSDCEDFVQDVFHNIWDNKGTYNQSYNAQKYIRGLVKHIINSHFRSQNHQIKAVSIESLDSLDEITNEHRIAEYPYNLDKEIPTFDNLISPLPPKTRQAVLLKYKEELSTREATKQAGCSRNTFYQRINRAHRIIKDFLRT